MAVALATLPAFAEDGLTRLVPLVELYDARKAASPGFDLAGIRCAGLFTAQKQWADRTGQRGPKRAQLADVELHLTRAEIYRRDQGEGVSAAYQSVLRDVQRVIGLYATRFKHRQAAHGHPWRGDGLMTSDTAYCEVLAGRR